MSGTEIQRRLRAVPFVPFRLRMTDGTRHAIRDPASVHVVPRAVRLLPGEGRPSVVLCPREIAAIEPI